ncbi:MAG: histidinol-phosphate transaminase [Gammaproteobacteria bacterium]|nr:histidinol-phosphate transaminase [Gammaproteobacteria bacterium]
MPARINPNIAGLTPYQPGKPVDELTRELGITDVIKLASNENPRGPGALVQEAIDAARDALSRYPDGNAFALKKAIASHIGVQENQLTIGNGSNDVLDLAARFILSPGAQAIISAHAFVVYSLATVSAGGEVVVVPACNYGADLAGFLDAVTDDTSLIFLANPNNPTGTWVDESELGAFLDAVPEHIWVVLDEAYAEYVDVPGYPDGVALQRHYPNLIVTRTFSKIHGLAGLRVGYGIASELATDLMNRARQPFNVNALAMAAAEAALNDQEFVAESRQLNKRGMASLVSGITALGCEHIPSVGNFICIDVGGPSLPVFEALLKEGVIVRPVVEYGLPHHLRVTVGLPDENQRFLVALGRVLSRTASAAGSGGET